MLPRHDDPSRRWQSRRGISLITCATKTSEFPKQTRHSVIFLIRADVLTDYLHLKGGTGGMLLTPRGTSVRAESAGYEVDFSFGVYHVYAILQTGPVVEADTEDLPSKLVSLST